MKAGKHIAEPITEKVLIAALRGALADRESITAEEVLAIIARYENEAGRRRIEREAYERKLLFMEVSSLKDRVDALTAPRHVKAAKFAKKIIQQVNDNHLVLTAAVLALQTLVLKHIIRD